MSAVNEGSTIGVLHGRKSATREDAREQLASKACAMPERVASTPGFLFGKSFVIVHLLLD